MERDTTTDGPGAARTALGLAIAPALPLVPVALASSNDMKVPGLLAFAAVGYSIALIAGLPLHLALRRRGVHGRWAYAALGGALGALPCAVLMPATQPSDWPGMVVAFVGYGACAALAFRFVVGRPRRSR